MADVGAGLPASLGSKRGRPRREAPVGNLKPDLMSIVGRANDVRELKTLLGRARLVTLVGPGGIGKSRLAREVSGRLRPVFPGGSWIVELADLRGGTRVRSSVARALGVSNRRDLALLDRVADRLGAGSMLLLDNCEHVIDAAAEIASDLLGRCGNLRILATSREPLGVGGEQIFAIQPLGAPEYPDRLLASDLTQFSALQLFADRALARDPEFRVTADNVRTLGGICKAVGGMPLAIELAASQLGVLSLEDLGREIEDQLGFTSLRRDVPERHKTMRAALDWTFDELTAAEKELWTRLWVFAGGATLEAVEHVCGHGELTGGVWRSALNGLIEKSVARLDASATKVGRITILEPLRLFGLEQAERLGTAFDSRRRHLEWCRTLIPAGAWPGGFEQLRWMEVVDAEYANLTAALDFALTEETQIVAGLAVFSETFLFWGLHGWYGDEQHYAEALIAAAPRGYADPVLPFAAGLAAWYTYEFDRARSRFTECLGRSDVSDIAEGLGWYGLALCELGEQDYPSATQLLEKAIVALDETSFSVVIANARYQLAQAHILGSGDYDAAWAALEPNLSFISNDDLWNGGMTNSQLGMIAWRKGLFDDAERLLTRAVDLQSRVGHIFGLAASLDGLAWVAGSTRRAARSAKLMGSADALYRSLGTTLIPGLLADRDRAKTRVREGLGDVKYRTYYEAGKKMNQQETVAFATGAGDDSSSANLPMLTRRELQVAELVSTGATNRQISFELMISMETVKTHVRTILKKLGFESRVQIAAWFGVRSP